MSILLAKVVKVERYEELHIVQFHAHKETLYMMSLELAEDIQEGKMVELSVNYTQVVIAKNFSGDISFENALEVVIVSIERGRLLSSVKVAFFDKEIDVVMSRKREEDICLRVGEKVVAFIQASALSIVGVLDV